MIKKTLVASLLLISLNSVAQKQRPDSLPPVADSAKWLSIDIINQTFAEIAPSISFTQGEDFRTVMQLIVNRAVLKYGKK